LLSRLNALFFCKTVARWWTKTHALRTLRRGVALSIECFVRL
jgi:hypothetical protein